jgi:hypothetical protein
VHEILFKAYEAADSATALELETGFEPWHRVDPGFFETREEFI